MPEGLPRIVVVLTAIVAFFAIFLGVKDYFQPRRDTRTSASTAATATQPDAKDVHKKNALASTRRKRISGSEANSGSGRPGAAEESESLLAPALANSTLLVVKDNGLHAMPAGAGGEQATMDADDGVQKKGNAKVGKPTTIAVSPECLPLPNMTGPGDVDAPYYRNWAREYSCQL